MIEEHLEPFGSVLIWVLQGFFPFPSKLYVIPHGNRFVKVLSMVQSWVYWTMFVIGKLLNPNRVKIQLKM